MARDKARDNTYEQHARQHVRMTRDDAREKAPRHAHGVRADTIREN